MGYEIEKVTARDWVIKKDGRVVRSLNSNIASGGTQRNSFTLKEAKSRIDKLEELRDRAFSNRELESMSPSEFNKLYNGEFSRGTGSTSTSNT